MDGKCKQEGVLSELKTEMKSVWKQINKMDSIYKVLQTLSENTAVLAEQMRNTSKDVNDLKQEVQEIKSIPSKNYNTYKNALITAVLSGLAGYFLAKFIT